MLCSYHFCKKLALRPFAMIEFIYRNRYSNNLLSATQTEPKMLTSLNKNTTNNMKKNGQITQSIKEVIKDIARF